MFGMPPVNAYSGIIWGLDAVDWWDPDHVHATAGRVDTAYNRGTSKKDATQATGAKQPKLAYSGTRRCFYCDGTYALTVDGAHLAGKTNFTIAALNKHTGAATAMVVEHSASWVANAGTYALVRGDGAVGNFSYSSRGDAGNCYAVSTYASSTAMKLQTQRSDFAASAPDEVKGFVGASAITIASHGEVNNGGTLTSQTINLFSRNNGTSFPLAGYVSDVWIFGHKLTDAEFATFAAVVLAMRGVA